MIASQEIKKLFLDFFEKNDHKILPSASLVPQDDKSIMFVNSGMVPFKNYFLNTDLAPYKRIATAQKCLRAGGKHNDLENVGFTARHHTFFEMLGNFSFGDYFKEEAILYAWNFLTKELKVSKEKLLVTFYHEDQESKKLWQKISGLPQDKIISIKTADNFWSMGADGPCGPCSEIFFDHGADIFGGIPGSKNEDGDRFVEIWNLVFMQFQQKNNEIISNLSKPSVDTGMGLERISAVIQGVHDNYETDLFSDTIKELQKTLNIQ
jgi:alanyl-tRNA synthetase